MGNGLFGGAVGGLLGGAAMLALRSALAPPGDNRWVPGAAGFAALGACLGLVLGLCQVLLLRRAR
jgi:hypothetical protein